MTKSYHEVCAELLALQMEGGEREQEVAYGLWYSYRSGRFSLAVEQFIARQDLPQLVSIIAGRWDGQRYVSGVQDAMKEYYKENSHDV